MNSKEEITVNTCQSCGETNNFKIITVDVIDFIEVEKEKICHCGHKMDHWSYGYWESSNY